MASFCPRSWRLHILSCKSCKTLKFLTFLTWTLKKQIKSSNVIYSEYQILKFPENYGSKTNYANETKSFLHILSNPKKDYFQDAVAKYKVLTAVPSKKYCNSVKISSILRSVTESREHAKFYTWCPTNQGMATYIHGEHGTQTVSQSHAANNKYFN